jgi:ubiquinone biosynthesis accessory factor UbiJ
VVAGRNTANRLALPMAPFGFGLSSVAPALANRALDRETWAKASLAAHAGSIVVVAIGPVATAMRIDASGKFESAPRSDEWPDLELTLSALTLPSFLANPARWDEFVVAEGAPELAATLKGLAETLPWFVERVFATALGPIVGQRVADAGRRLLALPEHAASRVGDSIASYARDESRLAVRGADVRSFGDEVAATASRVDTLAARLDALETRRAW